MKNKKEEFVRSSLKLQKEYDLSDQEMNELIPEEILDREKAFKKQFISKVGKELYGEAAKWYQNLSPRERAAVKGGGGEKEIVLAFAVKNPNHPILTSANIKKIERVQGVQDGRLDPITAVERDEEGRLRPAKKVVVERKAPRQPTAQELKKMSIPEIAKLIKDTRDALWPSGDDSDGPGSEEEVIK